MHYFLRDLNKDPSIMSNNLMYTHPHCCPLSRAHHNQNGPHPLSVYGGKKHGQVFLLDRQKVSCPHASTYTSISFNGQKHI